MGRKVIKGLHDVTFSASSKDRPGVRVFKVTRNAQNNFRDMLVYELISITRVFGLKMLKNCSVFLILNVITLNFGLSQCCQPFHVLRRYRISNIPLHLSKLRYKQRKVA